MSSEWHKIFSPPSEKMTIAPGLQVDFLNCPRGIVQITEYIALAADVQVGIPIESAELLAKTLLKWSKQWKRQNTAWKRSQSGAASKSKAGTSKRSARTARRIRNGLRRGEVLDTRAVALMDLADQLARFSRQISRVSQAANN